MGKLTRASFFKVNWWVGVSRFYMGADEFDTMYRRLYEYLSTLNPGQYFEIGTICKKPENRQLVIGMCDIYYHMDFFVNLEYDKEKDCITMLQPLYGQKAPYHPPDVYSKIVKDPRTWGVDPCLLFINEETEHTT